MQPSSLPFDFDEFLRRIEPVGEGVGIESLLAELGPRVSRRTLQRRLALWVAQGRLEVLGARRATRYRAVAPQRSARARIKPAAGLPGPTLSKISVEVRQQIDQPRALRGPVGYQIDFLDQYRPNVTAYLPETLRSQLRAMGQASAQPALAGTFAKDMLSRLLIDLSWASSQLEGNTYSRLDTQRLIEHGQAAEGKDALETQMILNHKQAVEYLVLNPEHAQVNVNAIVALHALLADGLMADPLAVGRIRTRAVEIGGSVYLPIALPQRLAQLLEIVVQTAGEIADPFEQAFFLMVHLPYLQPFEDVNKRVSRLAANIPFIQHNLCPLSFIDVPQPLYVDAMLAVYELNRIELLRDVFVWAYERSCQQYAAVKQNLVMPDLFRLKHRQALTEVVAALVRSMQPPSLQAIARVVPSSFDAGEHERFVSLVQAEFSALHVGNAVRFGIGPLEFEAWRACVGEGVIRN